MGIGPNNLGPDGKAGYTSCGHPNKSPFNKMDDGGMYKLDSGMYKTVESLDGPGQTPLAKMDDLSGDGKITQKDVLIGRGVITKEGNKI